MNLSVVLACTVTITGLALAIFFRVLLNPFIQRSDEKLIEEHVGHMNDILTIEDGRVDDSL